MNYNEYKAPAGKVLFNLDTFTYGNTILSAHDLNLIVLDKEEAENLAEEYRQREEAFHEEEQRKAQEEEQNRINQPQEEEPQIQTYSLRDEAAIMALNEDGEYEEVIEEDNSTNETTEEVNDLDVYKKNKLAELLLKGVKINSSEMIHEVKTTKYI